MGIRGGENDAKRVDGLIFAEAGREVRGGYRQNSGVNFRGGGRARGEFWAEAGRRQAGLLYRDD